MRRLLHFAALLSVFIGVSFAGDIAVLRNGFSIRHERREVIGDKTRLYTAGGFVEVPTEEIVSFEHDDTPAAAPSVAEKTIPDHVTEASRTTGIDPDFLNSVIHHESGFNPKAVSKKGAQGLMQLMPDTASQLGVSNSFDPGQNIQGGAAYLRYLLDLYHGDAQRALAAYNAGPRRVKQYNGVPPYAETRAYVTRIIREYNQKKFAEQKAARVRKSAVKKKAVPVSKTSASRTAPATKPAS